MDYQKILSSLKLTEDQAAELMAFGSDAVQYSLGVYDKYLKDGKAITSPSSFLRGVCRKYLDKKSQQAASFNSGEGRRSSKDDSYAGPQEKPYNLFVWREGLTNPHDIYDEDLRFERWLLSEDGVRYLYTHGSMAVPEHFQVFARDIVRYHSQLKQMKQQQQDMEAGVQLQNPVKILRPIAPRRAATWPGYDHVSTDEPTVRHWRAIVEKHVPCMIKSNRDTIPRLPSPVQEYAHQLCDEFLRTSGFTEVEKQWCDSHV